MRKDFAFIGLVLIVSAIYSYYKGYIENGIGFIMTTTGGYIAATGFFFKYEKEDSSPKKKSLPNKLPKK